MTLKGETGPRERGGWRPGTRGRGRSGPLPKKEKKKEKERALEIKPEGERGRFKWISCNV